MKKQSVYMTVLGVAAALVALGLGAALMAPQALAQTTSCQNPTSQTITFSEVGSAGLIPDYPHPFPVPGVPESQKGTKISTQYRSRGVEFSATNNGQVYISTSHIAGCFSTSDPQCASGPSGDNILSINSIPPYNTAATATTLRMRFVNPETGAQVSVPSVSFVITDGNPETQPRVVVRSFSPTGTLLETRNVTALKETISLTGTIGWVETVDNGGDGHTLDDLTFGPISCVQPTPTPTATPTADKPQCSDDEDNEDSEDTLADEADPGCHTDGNPENDASYDSEDDDERDAKKVVKAAVVKVAQITPVAVKVTAKTGAGSLAAVVTLLGATGLAVTRRLFS